MTRIYGDFAYGAGPRDGCWWDETVTPRNWPRLEGDREADVAIIGGGFTGLSAALHLAEAGADVVLTEAEYPGWGASGRNGGFCCMGGARISDKVLRLQAGKQAADAYRDAETAAVHFVAALLAQHGIDADTHSDGETQLAHRPKDMEVMRRKADAILAEGKMTPRLTEKDTLAAEGLGGPFYGALTIPVGFALNPRKYLTGLADAAHKAGARLFAQSAVVGLKRSQGRNILTTRAGRIRARQVIVATNGYSSETLPGWFRARYMPTQSNVLVTRPLTQAELDAQGWTSRQMCYDTRGLLHYFRLLPDNRFLFGSRGGLISSQAAESRARTRNRAHFDAMFPVWKNVEAPHMWSGMVCLSASGLPFAGPVPDMPGVYAGLAYHGNGVAMGSFVGRLLSDQIEGNAKSTPKAMIRPMRKFPLGRFRRFLMPPAYLARGLRDL